MGFEISLIGSEDVEELGQFLSQFPIGREVAVIGVELAIRLRVVPCTDMAVDPKTFLLHASDQADFCMGLDIRLGVDNADTALAQDVTDLHVVLLVETRFQFHQHCDQFPCIRSLQQRIDDLASRGYAIKTDPDAHHIRIRRSCF